MPSHDRPWGVGGFCWVTCKLPPGPTFVKYDDYRDTLVFRYIEEGDKESHNDSWSINQPLRSEDATPPAAKQARRDTVLDSGSQASGLNGGPGGVRTETAGEGGTDGNPQKKNPEREDDAGAAGEGDKGKGENDNGTGGTPEEKPKNAAQGKNRKDPKKPKAGDPVKEEYKKMEVNILKTLTQYRGIVGASKGIVAAVDAQASWSWLRAPNPLYVELVTKLKELESAGGAWWQKFLIHGDLKNFAKSMTREDMCLNMKQARCLH